MALRPQHHTVPSERRAQVKKLPAESPVSAAYVVNDGEGFVVPVVPARN